MGEINTAVEYLAAAVATIDGLRCKQHPDDTINAPEAQIDGPSGDRRFTMGGSPVGRYEFVVRVFVKRGEPRAAYRKMRDYMEPAGSTSVLAALENEDNYSSDVNNVTVTNVSAVREEVTTDGAAFLVADWDVEIIL